MNTCIDHIAGVTFHGRRGGIENAFRYSVDYVLLDAEAEACGPSFFKRNAGGLASLQDRDHGGAPGKGRGSVWVREVLQTHSIEAIDKIELLAQPRLLGHVFNPVSFWLCWRASELMAVVAEVTNTFGERHCYLVRHTEGKAIGREDRLIAQKIFYVSPFQPVEGAYEFRFDIREDRIGIWIDYTQGNGGLIATLTGERRPLTNVSIVAALLRRPLGSRRVLGLIHWQALKLWWKGARYRVRPSPPTTEVSQ